MVSKFNLWTWAPGSLKAPSCKLYLMCCSSCTQCPTTIFVILVCRKETRKWQTENLPDACSDLPRSKLIPMESYGSFDFWCLRILRQAPPCRLWQIDCGLQLLSVDMFNHWQQKWSLLYIIINLSIIFLKKQTLGKSKLSRFSHPIWGGTCLGLFWWRLGDTMDQKGFSQHDLAFQGLQTFFPDCSQAGKRWKQVDGYSWMSLGCSNTKRLTVRMLQTYGKDLHEGLHLWSECNL